MLPILVTRRKKKETMCFQYFKVFPQCHHLNYPPCDHYSQTFIVNELSACSNFKYVVFIIIFFSGGTNTKQKIYCYHIVHLDSLPILPRPYSQFSTSFSVCNTKLGIRSIDKTTCLAYNVTGHTQQANRAKVVTFICVKLHLLT